MTQIDRMTEQSYTLDVEEGGSVITAVTGDGRETDIPVSVAEEALSAVDGAETGDSFDVGDDFAVVASPYDGLDIDLHRLEGAPEPLFPITHRVSVEAEQLERALEIARVEA